MNILRKCVPGTGNSKGEGPEAIVSLRDLK